MKKFFTLLIFLAIFLSGCHKADIAPSEAEITVPPAHSDSVDTIPEETPGITAPEETPGVTVPEETPGVTVPEESEADIVYEYTQQPMVAVSVPITTETTLAEDGTLLFSHAYQTMHLVLPQDNQIADSIIIDFLSRLDASHAAATACSQQAVDAYSGADNWTPYFHNILYSPMRLDQDVLSLYGTTTSYIGINRPNTECAAANYNMLTGDVLTLGSILYHMDSKALLQELVVEKLQATAEETDLYEDYAAIVERRFSKEESYDEDWYFSQSGLCFFFAPYEIAPYTSGTVTIEIPYEELTGIIADEFFPAEEDTMIGTLSAQLLSKADANSFSQIAEVVLDKAGETVLLYADGAVRNVRIETGSWNDDGTIFSADSTVFGTYTLTPGDAIMVQASIPDTMPNLRITYQSGQETTTIYLCQSGEDGSVFLMMIDSHYCEG